MKSLLSRRSIRKYTKEDIPDDFLCQLLADSEHTQTMGNLQLYSVIITRDREKKHQLSRLQRKRESPVSPSMSNWIPVCTA